MVFFSVFRRIPQQFTDEIVVYCHLGSGFSENIRAAEATDFQGFIINKMDIIIFIKPNNGVVHTGNKCFHALFIHQLFGEATAFVFLKLFCHHIKRPCQVAKLAVTFKMNALMIVAIGNLLDTRCKFAYRARDAFRKIKQ